MIRMIDRKLPKKIIFDNFIGIYEEQTLESRQFAKEI